MHISTEIKMQIILHYGIYKNNFVKAGVLSETGFKPFLIVGNGRYKPYERKI